MRRFSIVILMVLEIAALIMVIVLYLNSDPAGGAFTQAHGNFTSPVEHGQSTGVIGSPKGSSSLTSLTSDIRRLQ